MERLAHGAEGGRQAGRRGGRCNTAERRIPGCTGVAGEKEFTPLFTKMNEVSCHSSEESDLNNKIVILYQYDKSDFDRTLFMYHLSCTRNATQGARQK